MYNSHQIGASKNKMNERSPKEMMTTGQKVITPSVACHVDPLSPLIRKIVICEEKNNLIEITHASSCSGFNCAPIIEWTTH